MKRLYPNSGFTLIELMTVMTILSILAAIAVPNFLNAGIRAKTARSLAEQEVIVWSLEMYSIDREAYPSNRESGKSVADDLNPLTAPIPYMMSLPNDVFLCPADQERYEFIQSQRGGVSGYFYVNLIQATGQRYSLKAYERSGSANYVVYGLGPKYSTEGRPLQPETFSFFNPSNGIASTGYITTFGP